MTSCMRIWNLRLENLIIFQIKFDSEVKYFKYYTSCIYARASVDFCSDFQVSPKVKVVLYDENNDSIRVLYLFYLVNKQGYK